MKNQDNEKKGISGKWDGLKVKLGRNEARLLVVWSGITSNGTVGCEAGCVRLRDRTGTETDPCDGHDEQVNGRFCCNGRSIRN